MNSWAFTATLALALILPGASFSHAAGTSVCDRGGVLLDLESESRAGQEQTHRRTIQIDGGPWVARTGSVTDSVTGSKTYFDRSLCKSWTDNALPLLQDLFAQGGSLGKASKGDCLRQVKVRWVTRQRIRQGHFCLAPEVARAPSSPGSSGKGEALERLQRLYDLTDALIVFGGTGKHE